MKKYLKDLFTQQYGSFLIKHGYTENKNSFVKFYDDIFARVYLTYNYDKNYDELQFDVIHSFTPLIFEIDAKCIYDGEDDFSLSRLSGEEYIADATDKSDVTNCISRMFSKYSELSAENEIEKYLKMLNDDMNDLKNSAPVSYDRIREYETDISYFKNLKNAILSDNVNVLKIETDKMKDNIKINQTKLKNL